MFRKFNFDYDVENDSLFLYDPKSKSKASIEIGDFIIDFNSKKEISGIELLNASAFFRDLKDEQITVNKELLSEIQECGVDITSKGNFIVIKLILVFKSKKKLSTPVYIPSINEPSPALAYQ